MHCLLELLAHSGYTLHVSHTEAVHDGDQDLAGEAQQTWQDSDKAAIFIDHFLQDKVLRGPRSTFIFQKRNTGRDESSPNVKSS